MPTREAMIERWRLVTADLDPATGGRPDWQEGPIGTFLHAFRPDGVGLAELFDGMPELEPVLERLRVVFERAGPETGHLYFIVSRPLTASDAEVVAWTRSWLRTVGQIAGELELVLDDEVASFLRAEQPAVEVRSAPASAVAAQADDPVAQAVYEATTELGRSWSFRSPAGPLLVEPCYQLACSYELAYWILTPLALTARGDPFAPAARLWAAGVRLGFEGSGPQLTAVAHRERPCPIDLASVHGQRGDEPPRLRLAR